MLSHACACAIVALYTCVSLWAQDPNIRWFQSSNAMPSTSLDDIEQDVCGNMLFSSHHGIFVYDGLHYTTFTQQNGLPNSSTFRTDRDLRGRIWITAYSGKISVLENNKIREFSAFNRSPYCGKYPTRIFFLSEDKIAVDLFRKGVLLIYRLHKDQWRFEKKILFDPRKKTPLVSANQALAWLEHGDQYSTKTCAIRQGNFYKEIPVNPDVFTFFRTQHEGIGYIAVDQWLFAFEPGGVKYRRMDKPVAPLYMGVEGSLWVTYRTGGLQELHAKDLSVKGNHFLKGEFITDLCQDVEGNLWIATNSGKLGMLPFSPYKKWNSGQTFSSLLSTVYAMGDTLFIGHANGDVGYWIPGKMEEEKLIFPLDQLSLYLRASISGFQRFQGKLYFTSTRNGLFRIDPKTLKVEQLMPKQNFSGLYAHGDLLYLTSGNGVHSYDGKEAKLFNPAEARVLTVTPEGELLMGFLDGLYTLRDNKPVRVQWPVKTDERVTNFAHYKDYTVVATYGRGLIVRQGERFQTIGQKDGLPSDFINSITFNSRGELIVTTGNGVAFITFDSKHKKGYRIRTIEGNACLDHDNYSMAKIGRSYFFCSPNGLLEVQELSHEKRGNPLALKSITLNGKTVQDETLSFDYDEKNLLEIHYRQNSFIPGENSLYYYRLRKDQKWIRTSNESLLLSNLAPGAYTLELYAINPYTGYRTETLRKTIEVIPRLAQRAWFKVLFGALILLILFLILRTWMRRREAKRKQTLEIQLEFSRLEARALRAQMNPHFIFNSLNSIQSFILKNDRDSAYKFLGKFSAMIREVLEHSQHEMISLADEIRALSNYLDLEKMRADDSFTYALHVAPDISPEALNIPIMLIQPLVENAVIHGVLPLEGKKGEIAIHFRLQNPETLEIVIRDNGIGREASRMLNARKTHYHQSMGTDISQERTQRYSHTQSASLFEIRDLFDEQGRATGTEVRIRIKYA